ncbi:MAG TPA: nickel pincer cofactor biosynthesis protein LarC [Candidatus Bathyarchaeia archaeon]
MTTSRSESTVLIDGRVAGVSGDKYLGALLDLGGTAPRLREVGRVVRECLPGTREVDLQVRDVERGGIAARLVTVTAKEEVRRRRGEVLRRAVQDSSKRLRLSSWGSKFALSTIDTLLEAESHVHRHSAQDVELHELGSADTLVDILGVASMIVELGLMDATWWSTPIAVGGGVSHFSGRDYPNPPPAVAEILRSRKFPMHADAVSQELSTPTGVAITINLAAKVSDSFPSFRPAKIGYGAGSKDLKEIANVLRLMVGESTETTHSHDQVVVLETNLDDVTGEVIGHAVERIMAAGARDVSVTPVFMKKNRPGHMISVITDEGKAEELARVLMEETGTLGVREIPVRRHIALRTRQKTVVDVKGKRYPLSVKTALDEKGKVVREKVEYADRKRLAERAGISIREVDRLVKARSSRR